ncbi:MAG: hypothetical protein ABIJ46_03580 [bacterium]
MNRTVSLILVLAVTLLGVVFSLGSSVYSSMEHHSVGLTGPCFGADCGNLLEEVACSVHCLTSGHVSSVGLPALPVVLSMLALTVLSVAFAAVFVPATGRPVLLGELAMPPPAEAIGTVVKRE